MWANRFTLFSFKLTYQQSYNKVDVLKAPSNTGAAGLRIQLSAPTDIKLLSNYDLPDSLNYQNK